MPRRPSDGRWRGSSRNARALLDDCGVSTIHSSAPIDAAERSPASSPRFSLSSSSTRSNESGESIPRIDTVVPRSDGRCWYAPGTAAALVLAADREHPANSRAASTSPACGSFPGRCAFRSNRATSGCGLAHRCGSAHRYADRRRKSRDLAPTLTVFANGQHREVTMSAAAERFEYVIDSVDRTFSYEVSAGSARSSRYTVTMVRPARVDRIDLHYVYPSFAGLAPRDEQDGGDIYAPAGTRVRLRVHADKPIAQGELALSKSTQLVAATTRRSDVRGGPGACQGRFVPHPVDRRRRPGVARRGGVLHTGDGRSTARRAHSAAVGRPADHAARRGRRSRREPTMTTASRGSSWCMPSRAEPNMSSPSNASAAPTFKRSARGFCRPRIFTSSLAT